MGTSLYQPDIPEAYLNLHFPILTEGGLDLKLGKFVTPVGFETIDPRSNIFTRIATSLTSACLLTIPARF